MWGVSVFFSSQSHKHFAASVPMSFFFRYPHNVHSATIHIFFVVKFYPFALLLNLLNPFIIQMKKKFWRFFFVHAIWESGRFFFDADSHRVHEKLFWQSWVFVGIWLHFEMKFLKAIDVLIKISTRNGIFSYSWYFLYFPPKFSPDLLELLPQSIGAIAQKYFGLLINDQLLDWKWNN